MSQQPVSRQPLTTSLEVVIYLAAHAVGIAAAWTINPPLMRSLVEAHRTGLILPVSLAISVVSVLVVMLIFLFARRALGALPTRPA
jgi:hypothetical protein